MADYVPTTEEVRGDYAHFQTPPGQPDVREEYAEGLAEFDAWLVEHDRQVSAQAIRTTARALDEADQATLNGLGYATTSWLHDHADSIALAARPECRDRGSTDGGCDQVAAPAGYGLLDDDGGAGCADGCTAPRLHDGPCVTPAPEGGRAPRRPRTRSGHEQRQYPMSVETESVRERVWAAYLGAKRSHRQARRGSFDAGWNAALAAVAEAPGLAEALAKHHPTSETDDENHPHKGRCSCGKWSYLWSNHLADVVRAWIRSQG